MLIVILCITFVLLNIIDVVLTNKILSRGGVECNPAMQWFMSKVGDKWGYYKMVFILIICLSGVYYIHSDYPKITVTLLVIINVGYFGVVWNNWKESKKVG
jgi:hypothetical protein